MKVTVKESSLGDWTEVWVNGMIVFEGSRITPKGLVSMFEKAFVCEGNTMTNKVIHEVVQVDQIEDWEE